jgi:hypothetical protein
MIRVVRDFGRLMRASRELGRASRLEESGRHDAAAKGYAGLLKLLDSFQGLPTNESAFSIRDGLHFSIRIVATTSFATLAARAGDAAVAQQRAREGLDLYDHAPRAAGRDSNEHARRWIEWARNYLRLE